MVCCVPGSPAVKSWPRAKALIAVIMDRAFGELEQAFYDSGGVLSQTTAAEDARDPVRRPMIGRSGPHAALSGRFVPTLRLGVPGSVELGGYYTFPVIDGPDDAGDYVTFELEDVA